MGYDVRPLVTMDEKAAFLERAARDGVRLVFEHDPDVESAAVIFSERGPLVADAGPLTG